MKKLATFGILITSVSALFAQTAYKPAEYLKKVAEVSGGAEGINVNAAKDQHESQLAALRDLVKDAPDQAGRDAVNGNICILLALTGQGEEAKKFASEIQDRQTREKRTLHITKILGGKQAALDYLNKLLVDPAIPPQEHIVYVEKFVSTLKGDEKFDAAVSEIATSALQKTQFGDSNARVGLLLVKYHQKALKEGVADNAKLRAALDAILGATAATPKTQEFLDASRQTLSQIPSN